MVAPLLKQLVQGFRLKSVRGKPSNKSPPRPSTRGTINHPDDHCREPGGLCPSGFGFHTQGSLIMTFAQQVAGREVKQLYFSTNFSD